MEKKQQVYRQGEILFIKLDLPQGLDRKTVGKDLGTKVIREGEMTGHMHEVIGEGTLSDVKSRWLYWSETSKDGSHQESKSVTLPEGDMFLTAENNIEVRHPEHATLKLEKGDYTIRIQREYSEQENQRVSD